MFFKLTEPSPLKVLLINTASFKSNTEKISSNLPSKLILSLKVEFTTANSES